MTRTFLITALLSVLMALPAAAQSAYSRGGSTPAPTPTPAPGPVAPTPPPVVTPPAPPPPPVFTSPLLLGLSSSGQVLTLDSVFSSLSTQIANYNNINPYDLGQAALNGASQTIVTPSSTASASTGTTGGSRFARGGSAPTPTPTAPTSLDIDVTGWSYLVLQWGDTNYHFYVGDTTGLKTFSGSAPLSSYTFFTSAANQPPTTSVPETLSTFAALSLAAALMGLAARRWGRKP